MKINVENVVKIQSKELQNDANFSYEEKNEELNYDLAHMIAQKTLLRINVMESLLNNTISNNDMQKNITKLTKKMLTQIQEDIDYMYPQGNIEYDNCHVVMQLIKRTGEDLSVFLECFEQKNDIESKIDMVQILKEQFTEFNNDIDYAYPNNNYDDDNAHVVLQGLLGKSEFLHQVLNSVVITNDEQKEFKDMYLDKVSGLIDLLNEAYDDKGYYINNGHDIFSQLIEGLKVELSDIKNIRLSQHEQLDTVEDTINNDTQKHVKNYVEPEQSNIDKKDMNVEPLDSNQDIKKKLKSIM